MMNKEIVHYENATLLQQLPQLMLLEELSGANGINRETRDRCQIKAVNDYEAIMCWLNEYKHKETTYRTYQKEAERLLLWSVIQQRKALSSLTRDDMEAYLNFLDNPEPQQIWCAKLGGRGSKRGYPNWRPFIGGLSHATKVTAISCIDSLFNYLVDARYLNFNPLSIMRKKRLRTQQKQVADLNLYERILTPEEWTALLETLEQMPETTVSEKNEKERIRFIVHILYFLGLRVSELTSHTWNAFRQVDGLWWFYVIGKGDKAARIPVNDSLLLTVLRYRKFLKMGVYPEADEIGPLIISFYKEEAITSRYINKILKKLALQTATKFTNPQQRVKLGKFSAHWLRHLSASMQDKSGIAFKHIRANHRHENDETTRRYVHALENDRHHDMQKLKLLILNDMY